MVAETQVYLELQTLVVQALRLADRAGLQDVGIGLDGARLAVAEHLQRVGRADEIILVDVPDDEP